MAYGVRFRVGTFALRLTVLVFPRRRLPPPHSRDPLLRMGVRSHPHRLGWCSHRCRCWGFTGLRTPRRSHGRCPGRRLRQPRTGEKPATHRRGSLLTDDNIEAISALTSATHPAAGPVLRTGRGRTHRASGMSESGSYQVNQRLLGSEQSTLYISDRDNDQNMLGTYRQGESAQNICRPHWRAGLREEHRIRQQRGTRRRANRDSAPMRTNPKRRLASAPPRRLGLSKSVARMNLKPCVRSNR